MSGSIILKPIQATLTRNVASFMKMDPYCVARYANINLKGQVCKGGALSPFWSEAFIFSLVNDQFCFIEVKNKDVLAKDSIIGICQIEIEKLKEEKESKKWYNLYYNQKNVGEIQIEAIYTEQKYSSRVVFYPQQKKVKESEEMGTSGNKLSMSYALSKHIPQSKESNPQATIDLQGKTDLQASPLSNTIPKSPLKDNIQIQSDEKKQELSEIKQKTESNSVQAQKQEEAIPQNSSTPIDPANESNTVKSKLPVKQKKKGWNLFQKIKKALDSQDTKKQKTKKGDQESKESLTIEPINESSAPLKRRKIIEEDKTSSTIKAEELPKPTSQITTSNVEESPASFILERRKPEKKSEEQNTFDFIDKENSGKMRGNYQVNSQSNYKNFYETDYKCYSESISRAKDLVTKVREQYDSEGFHSSKEQIRTKEPISEFNYQENDKGILVEDLSNNEKKRWGTIKEPHSDKPFPLTSYSQSVGEVLIRQQFQYR